jgi:tight adherence protein C
MDVLTVAILLTASLGLIVYSLFPRRRDERDAVKRRLTGGRGVDEVAEIRDKARASAAVRLVKRATPMLSRLILPGAEQGPTILRTKLANAGFRRPQAQTFFLASKTVLALIGVIVGTLVGLALKNEFLVLLGTVAFGAGAGFMLPNLWLMFAASGRQQRLRMGLPDTLDLLVVSVESGLALDAALKRVGEEMALVHPDMSEEMRLATMETQMGIPRAEALENMARRCGIEEVRSLVTIVLQAEKFGTSIARALRNQGDALRTKRQQAAEERAQKTAVKLMMPLVLFIFPAMGVVLAGPAAIKMIEAFKNSASLSG